MFLYQHYVIWTGSKYLTGRHKHVPFLSGHKASPASLVNEQNHHQMLHTSDKDEQPKAKKCSHCMLPSKRPIFTSCLNWSSDRARLFHFVSIEATGVSTLGPSCTVQPQ